MDMPQQHVTAPVKGPEPVSKKKIILLALALIALASVIVLWSYFDATSRDLDRELAYLETEVAELADQSRPPIQEAAADGKMRPSTPEGWSTAEGEGYLVDIPPGYKLSVGGSGFDYVHADPVTEESGLPFAVIRKLSAAQEAEYADEGGRLLIAGEAMYWMYLYENLEWKEFDQAAASLRVK